LKPSPFEYFAPDTLEEVLALLGEHGEDARPLAGGQSLVPMMAFRLARPSVVIDLNRLSGLSAVRADNGRVRVGAMLREKAAERSDVIAGSVPLLARALPLIGHEAIRSRGTVGGSISHSDPAGEIPAVAVATGAEMTAVSAARGERTLAAEDFFVTHFTTALEPDELLTEVTFPTATGGTGVAFEEMARRHGDFAIVGVGTTIHLTDGVIDGARVVLTGMADTPLRVTPAETVLVGAAPGKDCFEQAAREAVSDLDPPSDLHGTSAYRRHVAQVLIQRSLQHAVEEIGETR
jgi:CO/xanthine dehydrogenase FAD-binding subunit